MEETTGLTSYRRLLALVTVWISVLVYVATSPAASSSPLITIRSTVSTGETICPGKEIIFTCVTRESIVIGWRSNEYIGIGDQLEFSAGDSLDVTQRGSIDSNTIASFVSDSDENGTLVLVSQLQINVSSVSQTPSVTCVHGSNNIPATSTFQVLVDPGTPQTTGHQTEDAMGRCALHVAWTAPDNIAIGDITRYVIYVDGMNVLNETNANNDTLMSLSYPVPECAPHNISVGVVNGCRHMGRPSANITVRPEPLCGDSTCTSDSATAGNLFAVWQSLVGLFAILFVVTLMAAITFLCCTYKKRRNSSSVTPSGTNEEIKNPKDEEKAL